MHGYTKNWPLIEKELLWHLTAGENLAMQSRKTGLVHEAHSCWRSAKALLDGAVNKLNRFPQTCWGEPKICAMNL